MNLKYAWMVGAAAGLLGIQLASAQDAKSVIESAQKAMGNLKTVEYSGSGADFALGQAFSPSEAWPRFNDKSYTRAINFDQPASKMHRMRTQFNDPPHGGGLQPIVGERAEDQVIVVNDRTPWPQQLEIVLMPQGFLNAAAKGNATVKAQTVKGKKYQVVSFIGANKAPVVGYINAQNLVEKVATKIDNPLLGDMPFEGVYTDYKNFNGIQFPTHIVQTQGPYPILDLNVSDVKVNGPVSIQATPPPPPPPATQAKRLADGVFQITGPYQSLAIDFKDYIVVIEGPNSEARGIAVIEEAKKAIPNKPIKYVINTHNHIDHSSGLRPFVAEGSIIVTNVVNKPYFERVWKAPHTLAPDLMSKSGKKPKFETMTEKKVMTDGNHTIELYHVAPNDLHNIGIIMAWLPKERILVEADEFNVLPTPPTATPNPIHPYHPRFLAFLDNLKIDPQMILPIHTPGDGRIVTKAELMLMAGRSQAR